MKPAPFVHHAPGTIDEAIAVLAEVGHDGKILAGGQSLIPVLNMRLASPAHLIDINRVAGLDQVEVTDTFVRVGATVRHAQLENDDAAYAAHPLLRQALANVAHPAIRNRGTTVGSIAHADAAGEMPSILALSNGVLEVVGPRGAREITAADFFAGPMETTLEADELVVAARFGRFPEGSRTAFLESARRHGDYALAGVAVIVEPDGSVRASFVSVTDVPDVLDLSPALAGADLSSPDGLIDEVAAAVTELVKAHVTPEGDIHATADYRRMLAAELTVRALRQALSGELAQQEDSRGLGLRRPVSSAEAKQAPATGARDDGPVTVRVNGVSQTATVPSRRLLSDYLRHDLKLTGTHVGCEHGVCGACTVLVDGQPMRSCLMFAVSAEGHDVTTVEGLCSAPDAAPAPTGEQMNPVQQAFIECHGLQCGFCTPGFLTTVTAFLEEQPDPTDAQAREAISGNLCRCTGYQNIMKSVMRAAEIKRERADESPVGGIPNDAESAETAQSLKAGESQ